MEASYKLEQHATVAAHHSPFRVVQITTCKACGCRLNPKILRRHLAKVHKIPTDASPLRLTKDDHDEREASKYFGYFAREHGRFGSMPMYDDYGDKGTAE